MATSIQSAVTMTDNAFAAYMLVLPETASFTAAMACAQLSHVTHNGTALPCKTLLGQISDSCVAREPQLLVGRLYVVTVSNATAVLSLLQTISSFSYSRRTPRYIRSDLATMGVWLRYIVDKVALPLGMTRALYFDSDVVVKDKRVTAKWFLADLGNAPVAVVNRSLADASSEIEFNANHTDMPYLSNNFGFTSTALGFNNGVMLIDTLEWCRFNTLGRMLSVAHYHALVRPLWDVSVTSDQAPCNIVLGGHSYRLPQIFNCRKCWMQAPNKTPAAICHGSHFRPDHGGCRPNIACMCPP